MTNRSNADMLEYISDMYSNIKKSTMKVECILRYPNRVYSQGTRNIEYGFLTYFADKTDVLNYQSITDEMVRDACNDYVNSIKAKMKNSDEKKIILFDVNDENEKIIYADNIFITFVKMFHEAAEYINELENWSAERIARTVLDYMNRYYSGEWESGKSEEEYFLGCLLTTVGAE